MLVLIRPYRRDASMDFVGKMFHSVREDSGKGEGILADSDHVSQDYNHSGNGLRERGLTTPGRDESHVLR